MTVQTITNPKEQTVNVVVEPGQTIAFDFELDAASFERVGTDLTISLDDGGQIVLSDFFVASDVSSLPSLQLADGTEVNSGEFLAAFDVDVTPAAGETASSGINPYDDGSAPGVEGLTLSDSLGTIQWSATIAETPIAEGLIVAPAAFTPPPEDGFYNARAVLYEPDPSNYDGIEMVLGLNMLIEEPFTVVDEGLNYLDFTNHTTNGDGSVRFNLTQDALDAMQDSNGENVYDYITVTDANGVTYTIQVLLNQTGVFDSAAEDRAYAPAADFKGEWHTQNSATEMMDSSSSDRTNPGDRYWLHAISNSGGVNVETNSGPDVVTIERGVLSSLGNKVVINTGKEVGDKLTVGANLNSGSGGTITMTSGEITVNATTPEATVITKGGTNTLNASGDINITMDYEGRATASGLISYQSGSQTKGHLFGENIVTSDEGNVNVDVKVDGAASASYTASAVGLNAGTGSSNTVSAGGEVNVNVELNSIGKAAYGMYSSTVISSDLASYVGGENSIKAGTGADITVRGGSANETAGLYAKTGKNSVEVEAGNIAVSVTGGMDAFGMKAGNTKAQDHGAKNELTAKNGDISLNIADGSNATAMHAVNDGDNVVTASGKVDINANAYGIAKGMNADGAGSSNTINAGELSIAATGGYVDNDGKITGGKAFGMYAANDGDNVVTANGKVDISINTGGVGGAGIAAEGAGSSNIISAGELSINATGGIVSVMRADNGGYNEINAITVTLTVDSSNKNFNWAMVAAKSGINVINLTEAGSVTINGKMMVNTGGENIINGSAGNDTITINGNVYDDGKGGKNIINGGAGDDTFILNGVVDNNYAGITGVSEAFYINGGDGTDKLVLMAANATEFQARYGDWLSNPVNVTGVEYVEVQYTVDASMDMADFSSLQTLLANSFPDSDIIYNMGAGDGTLTVDAAFDFGSDFYLSGGLGHDTLDVSAMSDSLSLETIANMVDGFEHIELGTGSTLTIDDVLSGLNIDGKLDVAGYEGKTGLFITGEDADSVTIDPNSGWSQSPIDSYEDAATGITYDVYSNSSNQDDIQYLFIQNGLV